MNQLLIVRSVEVRTMLNGKRAAWFGLLILGGCGLYVPDKSPFSDDTPDQRGHSSQGDYENKIVIHVSCEVANGLLEAANSLNVPWLEKWGTTVTLTITAQEQGGVNPGVSIIRPLENSVRAFPVGGNVLSAQSFSLGIGASGSANATRTETVQFTYVNRDLMAYARKYPGCNGYQDGVMINGDLKIKQFIYDKSLIAGLGNANAVYYVYDKNGKVVLDKDGNPKLAKDANGWPLYNTFTEEIIFVASLGGNITPTWKFATSTYNSSSNFITAQRTYTNDLIMTIGPLAAWPTPSQPAKLNQEASNQHNNRVVGNSVATANQAQSSQ
jgi:hypothetical protein